MKPPVPYYGGKQRIADDIVAVLPPHEHYVEPFAGSLSVLFAKPPSPLETVNDIDKELMTFWRVLRERRPELAEVCALTPHSRVEHSESFTAAADDLEVARRVFVRLTQGRASRLTPTGWRFNRHTTGARLPREVANRIGQFAGAADRLAHVSLECRPALDVIADYGTEPTVLLYVDPPYLADTRNGTNYRLEMAGGREHRELAEALHAARATVVLSGYPSPLYDELYTAWDRVEIQARTDQGGATERTEVLWSNRPLASQPSLLDALEAS